MTLRPIAKSILGAVLAILMAVILTLLSCTTLSDEPVADRVITAIFSCSAGLVIVVTTMCLLVHNNSGLGTSSGSNKTKTENATPNFLHRFGTARPSKKTWKNRINGFSMLAGTTVQAGGHSTNKEDN
jgi:hypothetical protein